MKNTLERYTACAAWWRKHIGELDYGPATELDEGDDEGLLATDPNFLIEYIYAGKSNTCHALKVGELIEIVEAVLAGSRIPNLGIATATEAYVLVVPENAAAEAWAVTQPNASTEYWSDATKVHAAFVYGLTPLNIAVLAEQTEHKDFPICDWADVFVKLSAPNISPKLLESAVNAFLFAIARDYGAAFSIHAFEVVDPEDRSWIDEHNLDHPTLPLRPPGRGPGLQPLQASFRRAESSRDLQYSILEYAKIVEYASATATRIGSHNLLRSLLSRPEALRPDAAFLDEIMRRLSEFRFDLNDSKSVKITIQTACDPFPLQLLCPPTLKTLSALKPSSSKQESQRALADFADMLTATRNSIAHGKANYRSTGKECAANELGSLVATARLAAIQVIHWYTSLPPETRIHEDPASTEQPTE